MSDRDDKVTDEELIERVRARFGDKATCHIKRCEALNDDELKIEVKITAGLLLGRRDRKTKLLELDCLYEECVRNLAFPDAGERCGYYAERGVLDFRKQLLALRDNVDRWLKTAQ